MFLLISTIMLQVSVSAQLGNKQLGYCSELTIDSSWENLTDTATFTIPRKVQYEGKTIVQGEGLWKVGDKVSLTANYDSTPIKRLFNGYITAIQPGENIAFSLEDDMYLCKQKTVSYSSANATLRNLLTAISPSPFTCIDASLGSIRFSNRSVAYILKELRDSYGLYSWYRDGHLYSGLIYRPDLQHSGRYVFGENLIKASSLEYKKKEDVRIKVKAISIQPDNKRISAEFGDEDGAVRTIHLYNVAKSELEARAKSELERIQYTGYYGDFSTFGYPLAQHGDIAQLHDPTNTDRNGNYLIKRVKTTINPSQGYIQNIYLHTIV